MILASLVVVVLALTPAIRDAASDPTRVERSTWCPTPEIRTEAERRMEYVEVIARLREIRHKYQALHEGELFEDPYQSPGPVAEVDRLLMELTADCQRKAPNAITKEATP